jgi:branched-chain amino acid transport system substrate-binding protein
MSRGIRGVCAAAVTVLCVVATGVVGIGGAGAASGGNQIVIGQIENQTGGTITGKVTTGADALAAWAKWTNAHGGINGATVKVVTLDDKSDPAQTKSDLKELVEQDNVLSIVGENASSTEPTWSEYITQQQVPVIGGAAYSANWFSNPMFYPGTTTVVSNVWAQMYAVQNAKKNKVASLLCSNATVCQAAQPLVVAAAKDLSIDIVYNQLADANAVSYTPQCLAMKDAGAEVISPQGVNNVTLLRDCKRQSFSPLVITTNYQYTINQLKATPDFNGLIGPSPAFSPYNQYPANKDYFAALKKYASAYAPGGKKFNDVSMLPAINAWVGGEIFKKAVENAAVAKGTAVTRQDVIKGLSMFSGESLGGIVPPLTYSDGTKPNPQVKCFYLYKVAKSAYSDYLDSDKAPKVYCQP